MKKLYLFLICALCAIMASAKEDVSNIVIDMESEIDMSATIRDTEFGPYVVSGQRKVFGAWFDNYSETDKSCDFRYASFSLDGKLLEIYEGQGYKTIKAGGYDYFLFTSLVNLPEGDYYFIPIVRFEGESKWHLFNWFQSIVKVGYWKLHVYEKYDAPSCKHVYQQTWIDNDLGTPDHRNLIYIYSVGEKFKMRYDLINNAGKDLKGRIKIVYERNIAKYWRGHKYEDGDFTEEWFDCLSYNADIEGVKADNTGGIPLEMKAGEQRTIYIDNCEATIFRDDHGRWSGVLAAYFLPDGKEDVQDNWLMINEDPIEHIDENGCIKGEYTSDTMNIQWFKIKNETASESISNNENISYSNGYLKATGMQPFQEVIITSISGKLITRKVCESDNVTISLAGVPTGVYVATITENGKVIASHKFVK